LLIFAALSISVYNMQICSSDVIRNMCASVSTKPLLSLYAQFVFRIPLNLKFIYISSLAQTF